MKNLNSTLLKAEKLLKEFDYAKLWKLQSYKQFLKAVRPRRILFLTTLVLILFFIVILIFNSSRTKTYYIAFIGRYQQGGIDPLHELALRKYLDELNTELKENNIRLKLEVFSNEGIAEKSLDVTRKF